MRSDLARDLLENLLERASSSSNQTFLTSKEVLALATILGSPLEIKEVPNSSIDETLPRPTVQPTHGISIELPIITAGEVQAGHTVCIDFGTSLSKAFACIDNGQLIPELIALPIGDYPGSLNRLAAPSEMMMHDDLIYFGHQAREVFHDTESAPDRIIDSIKQYMTLNADVSNLGKVKVTEARDPARVFFQRDVLLLYLSHLMRLVENALAEKGLSRNIRRRFAHPGWPESTREKNVAEMRKLMAEAVVLSRSLGDLFLGAVPIALARKALDDLKGLKGELPFELIDSPVREATAAGAGAILSTPERQRQGFVIVDVGAGTTDVAGCVCVNNPTWDKPRVFEVTSAADAIPTAGNVFDSALVKALLQKADLMSGSPEHGAAAAALNRAKRANKELLFNTGALSVRLPTGELVGMDVDEFLQSPPIQSFSERLAQMVTKAAQAVGGGSNLILVATGGGARLPMIERLAREGIIVEGKNLNLNVRSPAPEGLAAEYPEYVDPYPQIAVALGGALPDLPEQKAAIEKGLSQAPEYRIAPMYKS